MKRWALLGIGVVLLTLVWLLLPRLRLPDAPGYTCRMEKDVFSLDMTAMNATEQSVFTLQGGDAIEVSVVHRSGELLMAITDSAGNAVYEGRNPELNGFQVNIRESGAYTVSVTGKQAEGSVSFRKRNGETTNE